MDPGDVVIPPLQLDVIDAVTITSRVLVKRLDREVGVLDFTWSQARTLIELADHRGLVHAGEMGRLVGVSRQAAHRTLAELDRRGLLVWRDDGHWKSARLNDSGEAAAHAAMSSASGSFDAVWRVAPAELRALIGATRSLRREVRRQAPEAAWWLD